MVVIEPTATNQPMLDDHLIPVLLSDKFLQLQQLAEPEEYFKPDHLDLYLDDVDSILKHFVRPLAGAQDGDLGH